MNAGVSSKKEKVKESQSRSMTPSPDTPSGAGLGASHGTKGRHPDGRILKRVRMSSHGLAPGQPV